MKRSRILIPAIALAIIVALSAAVYADLNPGTKAPDFTLPTLDGKEFSLSSCSKKPGKVVVLDLWATWCGPCRAEAPYLNELHKKYKNKDVVVVGVALDRSKDKNKVKSFVEDNGLKYTIALDPEGKTTASKYKVRGIPVTYIIDKSGVIRYVHSGFPASKEDQKKQVAKFEKEINSLLK